MKFWKCLRAIVCDRHLQLHMLTFGFIWFGYFVIMIPTKGDVALNSGEPFASLVLSVMYWLCIVMSLLLILLVCLRASMIVYSTRQSRTC